MKKDFLQELVGLPINAAKIAIESAGYETWIIPENSKVFLSAAHPNTVIIVQEKGVVVSAVAGDPLELK